MKIYYGKRLGPRELSSDVKVIVSEQHDDGMECLIRPLKHYIRHSPTGFEWGYAGSGPADLALSILWNFLGKEPSRILYMDFKTRFVARWKDKWEITEQQIKDWIIKSYGEEYFLYLTGISDPRD